MIIHQVYGLFKDGKPMNDLFTAGSTKWREYCDRNGHIYKLWNAEQCEELVNTYSEVKNYYYDVKYSIMKADIIRFLILYNFGGIYSDLDVFPNKNVIEIDESILTLCTYPNKKADIDIELISSQKYNKDLYKFITEYIPKMIIEKDNIEQYKKWKIRYVFQTTGPRSFMRFLKLNKIQYNTVNILHLSDKEIYGEIDLDQYLEYDFLSYFSMSYFQDIHKKNKVVSYKKKGKKTILYKNIKENNLTE
tara:strand:- start:186 stop:929 length:744 start_codon:yes stop_codon:yes gene_type:complete